MDSWCMNIDKTLLVDLKPTYIASTEPSTTKTDFGKHYYDLLWRSSEHLRQTAGEN